MSVLEKFKWEKCYGKDLDYIKLKSEFPAGRNFRVVRRVYKSGERIHGSMVSGKCFMFAGEIKYHHESSRRDLILVAGEGTVLPSGPYEILVDDGQDCELVFVWKIPTS